MWINQQVWKPCSVLSQTHANVCTYIILYFSRCSYFFKRRKISSVMKKLHTEKDFETLFALELVGKSQFI